jgi:hypothetical protein
MARYDLLETGRKRWGSSQSCTVMDLSEKLCFGAYHDD